MKNVLLFISLMLFGSISAQDITITKSEIFKDSKRSSFLQYSLEDGNGGLVIIRSFYSGLIPKLKGYYIQHFSKDLKLLKAVDYKVDDNEIKNAFVKDGKVHLIERLINKGAQQIDFNVITLDLATFRFSKQDLLSISKENQQKYFGSLIFPVLTGKKSQRDRDYAGEVVMSEGKNYFVINFDIKNKEVETHKIFVFNSNFELQYDQLIQKNIKDKYFKYNGVDIDDKDGTVYFLGRVYENESTKSKKDGKVNYHFELFRVNQNGLTNTSFKYDDQFVASLKLVKTDDELFCIGLYGNKNDYKLNGACLFQLNPSSLQMESDHFAGFSDQFMQDKYGNNEGKKERIKEKGIGSLSFRGVYLAENGDIVLNAEEYYVTTISSMDANGNWSTRTIHHFDDIVSLRMSRDGTLKWARNINKKQTGFGTSSFSSIPINDETYFFINCSDNVKKLSANRISFKQTKAKKSNLYMIKISEEGEFSVQKLIDDRDSKVYYKVNNGVVNLDERTVVLTGVKKKDRRILRMQL